MDSEPGPGPESSTGPEVASDDHGDEHAEAVDPVEEGAASAQLAPGSLAAKLSRLIEASRPAGRRPISNRALAQALTEAGTPVSTSFIAYLRDGRRDNPTYKVLAALAEHFKVPAGYFFDDDTTALDSQLELLMALRDGHIKTVLTRMPELRPSTRRWLAEQMPALKRMESGDDPELPVDPGVSAEEHPPDGPNPT